MTVYADVLFFLNSAIHYLLLVGSARLGGGRILQKRVIPAACLGGLYGVLALAPGFGILQTLGMKLLVPVGMVVCAFGAEKRTIRLGLLFFALAFGFAGLVLVSVQLFGGGMVLLRSGAYYPVRLSTLLLLAALCYLVSHLVFSRLAEHGGEVVPMTLQLGGARVRVRALQDTGNTLRDPISNERVLVIGWETAERLLPRAGLAQKRELSPDALMRELARTHPEARFRLIPYHAVGTKAGLLVAVRCVAERRQGNGKPVLAALSPAPVGDGGSFDALTGGRL